MASASLMAGLMEGLGDRTNTCPPFFVQAHSQAISTIDQHRTTGNHNTAALHIEQRIYFVLRINSLALPMTDKLRRGGDIIVRGMLSVLRMYK